MALLMAIIVRQTLLRNWSCLFLICTSVYRGSFTSVQLAQGSFYQVGVNYCNAFCLDLIRTQLFNALLFERSKSYNLLVD